jgi:Flp pilus assembly protein TadG
VRTPHRFAREEGAAAVEFALIAGVLFMLLFGMFEFGLAFWQVQNLRSSAREGARVAAVRGSMTDIQTRLVDSSAGSLPSGYAGFTVATDGQSGQLCDKDHSGDEVKVTLTNSQLPSNVQSAFQISIPFIQTFTINPDLSGTFRCE